MQKTPKRLIDKLENDWGMKKNNDNYPFIDDMDDMVRTIYESIEKLNTNPENSVEVVKHNTIVCIHALLSETLFSILSGLRIVLNPLNRSIIENLIILNFIIKNNEKCAEVFIANSEFVYRKVMLEHEELLSEMELASLNDYINTIMSKFSDVKFSKGYKWANQFIDKPNRHNTSLFEIAKNVGMEKTYNMLSNYHHQTHSSSAFAQHMNYVEFDDYDMYIMKAVMPFSYGFEVCRLVFDESKLKDIRKHYELIMEKYRKIYKKP